MSEVIIKQIPVEIRLYQDDGGLWIIQDTVSMDEVSYDDFETAKRDFDALVSQKSLAELFGWESDV